MQVNNNRCHSRESGNPCSGPPIKTFGGDRRSISGQTALVLILLAAAALIFLAITLNWGRIAQTKVSLSIAADQSASLLASEVASYGQMQKQTYLKDTNKLSESTGIFLALIMVVIAIITLPFTFGSSWWVILLAIASVVMAIANLVLQVMVLQPMITSLWNKMQKDQPVQQQIYEGGIAAALQASVQDQVKIADYFDWNADGIYGNNANGLPNDTVGRFAVFYTDRLKMINGVSPGLIPQVQTFYDQLGELMNGNGNGTCYQNPDGTCFKLNDACPGSDPSKKNKYSPYCDPCCQPLQANGITLRPSTCDQSAVPAQCYTNNPYNSSATARDSPYPLLYDSSFQHYNNPKTEKLSFLDQLGRDQQLGPFTSLTPDVLSPSAVTPILEFPNGAYPFFWLMKDYSPQVDTIDETNLTPSQYHWCDPSVAPGYTPPTGFAPLAQLSLSPYTCKGQDCCVNTLAGSGYVIDMAASPSFVSNASNPALDSSFGDGASSSWVEGDNQLCLTTPPYNGSSATGPPDGTCELSGGTSPNANSNATVDALDDTMHTLSDFVNFANTFLSTDVGTLSSTFSTWYPQAADWIGACEDGSTCSAGVCSGDGSSCVGRLPPVVTYLKTWSGPNNIINNWLSNTYVNDKAWCVPSEAALSGTSEDTYITSNSASTTCDDASACAGGLCKDGSACSVWGDLPHVNACLYYNSNQISNNGSIYNYQQCYSAVIAVPPNSATCDGMGPCAVTCPSLPPACAASVLSRSLIGPFNGDITTTSSSTSCKGRDAKGNCTGYTTTTTCSISPAYIQWVSNSLTLFTDEAPKFSLRYQFLNDVYTRAKTMQTIFSQGYAALNSFLDPNNPNSPASQLTWAFQHQTTATLPNSVIYGWVDATPSGESGGCWDPTHTNRVGCAHIVKVTAYSPGRNGASSLPPPSPPAGGSLLPWIQTKTLGFLGTTRTYTLMDRDGFAWVGIRRWDEDHNPILFPNGHTLWQFLFHNPNGGVTVTGQSALPPDCISLPLEGSSNNIGIGLAPATLTGLQTAGISQTDAQALGGAFMFDGSDIDPNSNSACLNEVNALLANAPESHACAAYIASLNASAFSGNKDNDYSVRFVSDSICPAQAD